MQYSIHYNTGTYTRACHLPYIFKFAEAQFMGTPSITMSQQEPTSQDVISPTYSSSQKPSSCDTPSITMPQESVATYPSRCLCYPPLTLTADRLVSPGPCIFVVGVLLAHLSNGGNSSSNNTPRKVHYLLCLFYSTIFFYFFLLD